MIRDITRIAICVLVTFGSLNAQELNTSNAKISDEILDQEKTELVNRVKSFFSDFIRYSKLSTVDEVRNFHDLCLESTVLFSDYQIKDSEPFLEAIDYTDRVEVNFEEGLTLKYLNPVLESINVNSDSYYIARISFTKEMYSILNSDGSIDILDSPLISDQELLVEIDPYEFSRAYIVRCNGERRKNIVEKAIAKKNESRIVESIISGDLTYKSGMFTSGDLAPTRNDFRGTNAENLIGKYTSFPGVDVLYRRSIDKNSRLFLSLGLGFSLSEIETNLSSFEHQDAGLISTNATVETKTSGFFDDNLIDRDEMAFIFISNELGNSFNGVELIRFFDLTASIGLGAKLLEFDRSHIMLDVLFTPRFIRPNGDGTLTGDLNGIKLPISDNFPLSEIIADDFQSIMNESGSILSEYTTEGGNQIYEASAINLEENLSFGLKISPTYQFKIGYNVGVDIGLEYYYSFTNLFGSRSDNDDYDFIPLLEGENSTNRSASIYEDYFDGGTFWNWGAKIGVFVMFDNSY